MTNNEILNLIKGIKLCGEMDGGTVFVDVMWKNYFLLERYYEAINKSITELQRKHAKLDKDGNVIIENGKIFLKNKAEWDKEFKELMEIDNKINLHKIRNKELPKSLTINQKILINPIIEK